MEEFRLSMTSEEGDTTLYLQFVDERVEEVKALIIDIEEYDQIGAIMRCFVSQAAPVRQTLSETEQVIEDPWRSILMY